MENADICYLPATEMATAIKAKQLSPPAIIDSILSRIERLNPIINAYCTLDAENARKQAKEAEAAVMRGERLGPLHGVPVSIKDLIFTRGIRTTGGSRIYRDFIPQQDAIVVERLKKAGAIVIGKTNTSEFGWVAVTDNPSFGATLNPWNLGLTPGGSSGGAAAAVALGMGPIAIGSDGGGSIRIPASFCGVCGFKPSFGLVPQYPCFPGWGDLSHTGPITRTIRDTALVMEVIAGLDDRDFFSLPVTAKNYLSLLDSPLKGLKIAWSRDMGYASVDRQVLEITEKAARIFSTLGSRLEAATPDTGNPEKIFSTIVAARLSSALGDKIEKWQGEMSPGLVRFIQRNRNRTAGEYIKAEEARLEYREKIRSFFTRYDLLLTPTVAVPPFELGIFGVGEIAGVGVSPLGWMPFTYPFNLTGQPAISIPCGWTDDGLPVGLQIIGRRFDDATVLKAAAAFEQLAPWTENRPALD